MKLYNSLTRQAEELAPLEDGKVSLYTCGLTVYSQPHIGNWAAYIYWDVLVRTLQAEGLEVNRVQNITDVGHLTDDADEGEDKLAKGARREQTTVWAVAEKYAEIAENEADRLGLIEPNSMPKATEYIDQQIAWNEQLETAGFTYEIDGKGLYFDTSKLDDYGKLANVELAKLQPGKRVDDSGKKNPTDFVLWRLSPSGLDPEVNWEWDSPWGKGIPGWHLECSVMAAKLLGEQIDIHTGGVDHINVHHTNEIAQTEAITKKPFAKIWLHNEHLLVDGKKMSKSIGNIYTLKDIVERGYSLDAFKLMVLSSHYRTQGNFTWRALESAQHKLDNWMQAVDLRWQIEADNVNHSDGSDLLKVLKNDLATTAAINNIDANITLIKNEDGPLWRIEKILMEVRDLLGIDLTRPNISDNQKQLLKDRRKAREGKKWTDSDQLRDELADQGIFIDDTDHGQRWHWK